MAPKHPVPEGYGSPCNEGDMLTQGTGSRRGLERYSTEDATHYGSFDRRFERSIVDDGNMFDEC